MRHLAASQMPVELRNSGMLHGWLCSLDKVINGVGLPELALYSRTFHSCVLITPPVSCGIVDNDWEGCLDRLWKTLIEPRKEEHYAQLTGIV